MKKDTQKNLSHATAFHIKLYKLLEIPTQQLYKQQLIIIELMANKVN